MKSILHITLLISYTTSIFPTNLYLCLIVGPAPSKHGNLGPVPAPVARGCHGPLKHSYLPNLGS